MSARRPKRAAPIGHKRPNAELVVAERHVWFGGHSAGGVIADSADQLAVVVRERRGRSAWVGFNIGGVVTVILQIRASGGRIAVVRRSDIVVLINRQVAFLQSPVPVVNQISTNTAV